MVMVKGFNGEIDLGETTIDRCIDTHTHTKKLYSHFRKSKAKRQSLFYLAMLVGLLSLLWCCCCFDDDDDGGSLLQLILFAIQNITFIHQASTLRYALPITEPNVYYFKNEEKKQTNNIFFAQFTQVSTAIYKL